MRRRGEVRAAFIFFIVGLALLFGGIVFGFMNGFLNPPNVYNPHPPPTGLALLEIEVPIEVGVVSLAVGVVFLFWDNIRGLFRLAKDYITEETSDGQPEVQSDDS